MAKKPLSQKEAEALIKFRKEGDLPHIYGWRWYPWAWKFYKSTNRFNFLCAANQISKSSTQIRKAIEWATNKSIWKTLWKNTPTQIWYFYPSKPVATTEFHEKWVTEFLPRGAMKTDPTYGWKEEIKNKEIWALHFNSGVSIYFKSYDQDTQNMQTGTVYAIFADEEMPFEHFNEIRSRLVATNGYFHMVFTATLGQEEWRRTIEPKDLTEELFPDALKIQVSMYDCLKYTDGTDSFWTYNRIKEVEMECATEAEVLKRVYGRFVISGGLKYQGFERTRNLIPYQVIPDTWHRYSGIDPGSGGEKNHPAAIIFVAVRPDFKFGIIYNGWRGDGVDTASSDILSKHMELTTFEVPDSYGQLVKKQHNLVLSSYDWQARDFFLVATKAGIPMTPADKHRDRGAALLNTLFKLRMLVIMEGIPELSKLVVELTTLKEETPKARAKDDMADATRYANMPIPWDFDGVAGEILKLDAPIVDERSPAQVAFDERRGGTNEEQRIETIDDQFEEWQSYIDV